MPVQHDTRATAPVPRLDRTASLRPPMPYLPGLDGLRALAVIAVVLYHLDLPWIPGGFLGVDVFFVLSGFLITTLVLEEVERTGRLSYRRFYLRRARRLLPALGLLLLTVSAASLLFLREELTELRGDVVAALLYVSNWWYIVADQSYFEFTGRPPLLQHLWSLAVEEQFYLVWPAVVVMAMATGRRRVRRVALVLAIASTVWMALLSLRSGFPVPNDPSRVYYGTDTHAMGLLVGAALATVWAPWRRWSPGASWLSRTRIPQPSAAVVIDVAGVLGLLGVGWFFLRVGEFSDFLYRGGFLVLAVLTVLGLAALANPAGVLGQIMAVQPLRYIGERSYGIYLWHWPVFMVTRPGFELPFDGAPAVLLRVGITLLLAEASYRLVEMPIRRGAIAASLRKARERTPAGRAAAVRVVAVTLTLALVVWTVGVGLYRAPAQPSTPSDVTVATFGAEGTQATGPSADGRAREAERETIQSPSPTPSSPATPTPSPDGTPGGNDKPNQGSAERTEPKRTTSAEARSPAAGGRDLSVFGDSVVYGAKANLREAGAKVKAGEGLAYSAVFDAVRTAKANGSLRDTVVLHVGNNGPIAERDLQSLINDLRGRGVVLVNLLLPRSWESHNNALFARLAQNNANVTVIDWNSVARANPSWLYDDRIHLVAPEGREGYARWLIKAVTT